MNKNIFLSGCEFVLGETTDIAHLPLDKETIAALKKKQVEACSVSTGKTIPALAADAIRCSLNSTKIDPSSVEAVVFCTSSYWHYQQISAKAIGNVLDDLGLGKANLILTSVMGCHNAPTGMRLARNLIRAENYENVILVTCDLNQTDVTRLTKEPAIMGDGAASCVISSHHQSEYRLIDIAQLDRHSLGRYTDSERDSQLRFLEWMRGAKTVVDTVISRNGLKIADIKAFIPNNYNAEMSQNLAKKIGVNPIVLFPFNAMSGHVWSSDVLISLSRIDKEMDLKDRDTILLLGTGPQNFGAVLLEKVIAV